MNQNHLSRIVLKGFKSIRKCDLELKELNVLIGANGSGKSNFISFFRLIQREFDEVDKRKRKAETRFEAKRSQQYEQYRIALGYHANLL